MRTFKLLFIFWAGLIASACAYNYPIGIPPAWIEPDVAAPARPDPWTTEVPGYYYINYSTGTDSGRTWGTPTAPRKTIPSTLGPGTRCEVEGNYLQTSGTKLQTLTGTSGAWVANTSGLAWLIGNTSSPMSFSGSWYFSGEYFCVDNVTNAAGQKKVNIGSTTAGAARIGRNVLFRNSTLTGTGTVGDGTGLAINGNTDVGGKSTDVIVYNCEVSSFGPAVFAGSDLDYVGILVADHADGTWILDNHVHHIAGGGLQLGSNTADTPRILHAFRGRNHIHDTWGTGMAAKTARYIVDSQNHVYNVQDLGNTSPSKAFAGQYGATDHWMIFNRAHDCANGVRRVGGNVGVDESLYVIGNTFYDITPMDGEFNPSDGGYGEAGIVVIGVNKARIIGNTIYDTPSGILSPAIPDMVVENNIIAEINEVEGEHFLADGTMIGGSILFRNNLFYQSAAAVKISIPGSAVMDVAALNASSYGSGNLSGDPVFTDAGADDFSILTGSPAKFAALPAASLTEDVYALFLATFGVSINVDANGGAMAGEDLPSIGKDWFGSEVPDAIAPDFDTDPSITGTASEGATLTGNLGTITGTPSPSLVRQWIRCDAAGENPVDISGATGASYTLAIADVGKTIRFKVTATNIEGSAVATSAQTGVVAGVTVARPTFSPTNHVTFPEP